MMRFAARTAGGEAGGRYRLFDERQAHRKIQQGSFVLLLVTSIKLVAEIALLVLAGRWLVGILAGAKREQNFFYRTFSVLARPFIRAFRAITPALVIDRHVPLLTFFALGWIWLFAVIEKVSLCQGAVGQGLCR